MIYLATDDLEDIRWVRDVHWPSLPLDVRFIVLYGNEDWPYKIEAYLDPMLEVDIETGEATPGEATPDYVLLGRLHKVNPHESGGTPNN